MNTTLFECVECNGLHFNYGIAVGSTMYLICTQCHTTHKLDTSQGFPVLTHVNGAALVPQQEPAVQVPATAPAAGHLSATSPITLSDDAQHQVIPNCPSCGAQYADFVHDPVLKIDFIMCSDCDFEGEASQHLSTETVDK
jgi:transcription elongation factor Elf1